MSHQRQSESQQKFLDTVDLVLSEALRQGASACEASIGKAQGISVTVRQGSIETVEHNCDKSLNICVYHGHHSGNISTSDFSKSGIISSVSMATNIAKYIEQDPFNGLADKALLATEFPDLDLYHPYDVAIAQAEEMTRECEQAALQYDNKISNSEGATFASHSDIGLYANSHDFRGFARSSRHTLSCSVLAGEENDMQRDYDYDSQRRFEDLALPSDIGRCAAEKATGRLNAHKIKTGAYPVVFETAVATSLFSHLASAISGGNLYRKASFLLDKKGQQIFSDIISIAEKPHLMRGAGSAVFDAEGVATKEKSIVEKGVLNSYFLGSYSARKLAMESTGNAGGIHNLIIESTSNDGLEALLKTMGTGLLVTELIGHSVSTLTGDYSRGAFGFWVEAGEIQYPVQEITIAGNLKDMFMGMVAVAADCDQRKNIQTGSVLIDTMTVAGM